MSGQKIVEGLKEAIADDFSRVTIDGQTWLRATELASDLQEIMRINNALRGLLNEAVDSLREGYKGPDGLGWSEHDWLKRVSETVTQ